MLAAAAAGPEQDLNLDTYLPDYPDMPAVSGRISAMDLCGWGAMVHVVPLSDRAVAILREARAKHRDSVLCFPNAKGKPSSDMVFTKTLRDMGLAHRATAHGFRTAFKV